MNKTIEDFIAELSSKSPAPGGGGASALIGAIGVALCSMVANLTSGKSKYAQYQATIDDILIRSNKCTSNLLGFIKKDADVFEPLSAAYSFPKDNEHRDEIIEKALCEAVSVPMMILKELSEVIDIIEQLSNKSSKLAISDVGVAASACRSAVEGAAINVYINTNLMKNKDYAAKLNSEANAFMLDGIPRCESIYRQIADELRSI